MSDGKKAYVGNGSGDGDLSATNDVDGTIIEGGLGNDILRGGRYDDILNGGGGDDQYFGSLGRDQFRFFGSQIDGASDSDDVYDLNFGEGDRLVFGDFGAGTFTENTGVNAFSGGDDAIVSSLQGLVNLVNDAPRVFAFREGTGNNNLVVQLNDVDGQTQFVVISDMFSQFEAAGGMVGLGV